MQLRMEKNMEKKLFEILKERGYVKDLTDEDAIKRLVNGPPMTFYLGIDPTADSLHIGHFFALTYLNGFKILAIMVLS